MLWLPTKKSVAPNVPFVYSGNNKNTWFTEINVRGKYGEQ